MRSRSVYLVVFFSSTRDLHLFPPKKDTYVKDALASFFWGGGELGQSRASEVFQPRESAFPGVRRRKKHKTTPPPPKKKNKKQKNALLRTNRAELLFLPRGGPRQLRVGQGLHRGRTSPWVNPVGASEAVRVRVWFWWPGFLGSVGRGGGGRVPHFPSDRPAIML